ncbi:fimbrial biogenesis chaperone [Pseudocitrobacter cyperus]|uniref:Molecular chaperone n=1 Tax=Pseudocitrobacter cyperus TaxID=3112843 RepID=A0ABV0HIH7_9ENTR
MRIKPFLRRAVWLCLSGICVSTNMALASGLQVSPVSLTLKDKNADGIWLSNEGDNEINAQVRVFQWSQSNFKDNLTASRDLVISPPMLTLRPGQRQLIRVIRLGNPTNSVEESYRLSVNELPQATPKANKLEFVLHYSLPIFIQPKNSVPPEAKLSWGVKRVGNDNFLEVSNQGNSHAQLSGVTYINKQGARREITPGLLGYVLPGSTMRWILAPTTTRIDAGGKLEVMINGQKAVHDL